MTSGIRFEIPCIPIICNCVCGQVIWIRGKKYINGHYAKKYPLWKGKSTYNLVL